MAEEPTAGFRARYADIDRRLDATLGEAERAAVKAEIIGLFRAVEQAAADLGALREEIRALVEKWKVQQASAAPSLAPRFSGDMPVVRADHLGASTFIEKGWSRLSLGDYDGAEVALARALELSPGDVQGQALLGWAQMLNEKYDEAVATFQQVLMRDPSNAIARINVGYICLKKHLFGEAIEHLSKAIRLDNDKKATLYANFYLGLVYLEREMYEDAENFFLKAIALGPNLVEAYFEMGRAYWFNGQRDAAIGAWQRGVAANRFNPWAGRCAQMLETVDGGGEPART